MAGIIGQLGNAHLNRRDLESWSGSILAGQVSSMGSRVRSSREPSRSCICPWKSSGQSHCLPLSLSKFSGFCGLIWKSREVVTAVVRDFSILPKRILLERKVGGQLGGLPSRGHSNQGRSSRRLSGIPQKTFSQTGFPIPGFGPGNEISGLNSLSGTKSLLNPRVNLAWDPLPLGLPFTGGGLFSGKTQGGFLVNLFRREMGCCETKTPVPHRGGFLAGGKKRHTLFPGKGFGDDHKGFCVPVWAP